MKTVHPVTQLAHFDYRDSVLLKNWSTAIFFSRNNC